MATAYQHLSSYAPESLPDGSGMRIGVVTAMWNQQITQKLLEGCLQVLREAKVKEENIVSIEVPGSFELPTGALFLLESAKIDGVVCLGCVVKGETRHNEYINHAVAHGLVELSIRFNKPVIFGVLTTDNMDQALQRAGGVHGNKGVEAAVTALQMIALKKQLLSTPGKVSGFLKQDR